MAKAPAKGAAKKAGKKAMTKSQFVAHLADKTQLSKKQVDGVLAEIAATATDQLKATGQFVLPGVARLKRTYVEAKKGGVKKINQLTGKEYETKDKPAHYKVKILPIKAFKTALL
jgi:nucleoid DNA-binding protein